MGRKDLTDEEYEHIEALYKKENLMTTLFCVGGCLIVSAVTLTDFIGKELTKEYVAGAFVKLIVMICFVLGFFYFLRRKAGNRYGLFRENAYTVKRLPLISKKVKECKENTKGDDMYYAIFEKGKGVAQFVSEEDFANATAGFEILVLTLQNNDRLIRDAFFVSATSKRLIAEDELITDKDGEKDEEDDDEEKGFS